MDLIEDKPREHPKPTPFCQNALLQPTVPEVSLLMQENFSTQSEKRKDACPETEFQTYNSWKWKYLNHNNSGLTSSNPKKPSQNVKDCYVIKDKYFTSDIEKRKNEILYGELEEPRRPLPPRAGPIIPSCVEPFFLNTTSEDLSSVCSIQEKKQKAISEFSFDKNLALSHTSQMAFKKELDSSEKLYTIISEQNKQMQVLQNQIEQLLKLQDVKDKQIEQLLKSQEAKEKKIKQLLHSLNSKDKELDKVKEYNEKQEQHLQEILRSQENLQKENFNLKQKLNDFNHKDMISVSVMTCIQMIDASTCTSSDNVMKDCTHKKTDNTFEKNISILRDDSKFDERDKSLSLHSSDLPAVQENAPTPLSSIHLDIQEFPDSSDDSESEPGIPSNSLSSSKVSQSNPLGYTFYNNVLTQLKDIIHNSGDKEVKNGNEIENTDQMLKKPQGGSSSEADNRSVQSYHAFDVLEQENVFQRNKDLLQTERFTEKFQNFSVKDSGSPSDISLKINALAVKYLKQEQISEFGLQTQVPAPCQHDVTIYNVTNLSFGSMRYLDRYQMLPKVKESQKQYINVQKNEYSPAQFLKKKKKMTVKENIKTSIGNILDISTLNQQPKLL